MEAKTLVVLVMTPADETPVTLARTLVEERLAACVNIVPQVRSIYRWQGTIEDEPELLCLIKTTPARFADVERRVTELHPYEVPEIIALPVIAGNDPYLRWVGEQVQPSE